MQAEALEAVRRGADGVHLAWRGRVLLALELVPVGARLFIRTEHLDGSDGPMVPEREARALERDYETE